LARAQSRQGNGSIQVVEHTKRCAVDFKGEPAGCDGILTVRGDDDRVRGFNMVSGLLIYSPPVAIQHELCTWDAIEIAMRGVVGDIALEEHHVVSAAYQCSHQATPQSSVAIAPRRAQREPEDDELHASPAARPARGAALHPANLTRQVNWRYGHPGSGQPASP